MFTPGTTGTRHSPVPDGRRRRRTTARRLVIVSRQHPDLYVYLRDRFAAEDDVEVVLDRRLCDPRRNGLATGLEQLHPERRVREHLDTHLRERSHVIVELA